MPPRLLTIEGRWPLFRKTGDDHEHDHEDTVRPRVCDGDTERPRAFNQTFRSTIVLLILAMAWAGLGQALAQFMVV